MDLPDDPLIVELNERIQKEQDPKRLAKLCEELTKLIDEYQAESSKSEA